MNIWFIGNFLTKEKKINPTGASQVEGKLSLFWQLQLILKILNTDCDDNDDDDYQQDILPFFTSKIFPKFETVVGEILNVCHKQQWSKEHSCRLLKQANPFNVIDRQVDNRDVIPM